MTGFEGASGDDADAPTFTLRNGGAGPDPLSLAALDAALAVVVFHRDHYCGYCREQARRLAARHDEFRERDVAVVTVLPEPVARARSWADRRDAPFPVLADPDGAVADRYGQPTRFGPIGTRIDLVGRLPLVAVVDLRGEPALLRRYAGETSGDRPTVDELLAEVAAFA